MWCNNYRTFIDPIGFDILLLLTKSKYPNFTIRVFFVLT